MHDGMSYDPIQGKVMGLLKFRKWHFSMPVFSTIYSGSWQMTTDSYTTAQYLNFFSPDF